MFFCSVLGKAMLCIFRGCLRGDSVQFHAVQFHGDVFSLAFRRRQCSVIFCEFLGRAMLFDDP